MKTFFHVKHSRNKHCQEKDVLVRNIIDGISILHPDNFYAMLMPGLYGPELEILSGKGVPPSNIFAVEREPDVWAAIGKKYSGLRLTPEPMPIVRSVDVIESIFHRQFNLVYIDLYGVPNISLARTLRKLFVLNMLAPNSTLMVTCGCTRGTPFINRINDMACGNSEIATGAYMQAAAQEANRTVSLEEHPYFSVGNKARYKYVTTVASVQ